MQQIFPFTKSRIIQSGEGKPLNIGWLTDIDSRKIDLSTTIVVQEGQIALLILNQAITAILESGSFPLHWIFDSVPEDYFTSLKVYFFTTKIFTDQRWGTATPILLNNVNAQTISLRAHGTFSYHLDNPKKLWRHISFEAEQFSTEDLIGELRSIILNQFTTALSNKENDIHKLMHDRKLFSQIIMHNLSLSFKEYGLKLNSFLIQSVSFAKNQDCDENFTKLEKLNELYRQDILTKDEYQNKKKELLESI